MQADQNAWVDQFTAAFEASGLAPVPARILGRLMICDPPEQSSAELASYCHASRGAISTGTRMLIALNVVERVRQRGSRAAYFRIRDDAWSYYMHADMLRLSTMRALAAEGLRILADRPQAQRARLQDFHDLNDFFAREYPALLARWDAIKHKGEPQ